MRRASKVVLLLAFLALLIWVAMTKGGLCRSDPDPRPAECKSGDKECNVTKPAEPSEPPIGKAP